MKVISVFGVERTSECMTASVTSPAYLDTFCVDGEGNPPHARSRWRAARRAIEMNHCSHEE